MSGVPGVLAVVTRRTIS
ncbi:MULTISPECIES: chloramphenicol resistance leader peptide [Micrococcales]|nr:hypothetical protein EAO79_08850 [Plantibacter sp. PA-3-X8]MBD8465800.1 chloramphenicol resistance leader peptide [Plantibacter sp. CFBP 8798]